MGKFNVVEELRWRGMVHDHTPELEDFLNENSSVVYLGVDPTADSLHIGHLVTVSMLRHFQRAGHKPILVMGGATGMVGDPSGKSAERNLLSLETIRHNQAAIQEQASRFLDFEGEHAAEVLNNYDWMKEFSFLDFVRDVGKYITVNYMMAKDSVKLRLSREGAGLSFTEFTYQLLQGYDFLHLYEHKNCRVQIGGSDQWGNITTGGELIRKKLGGKGYALTCPLITKSDGSKFGKSEAGNVWLNADYTSTYKFYQFWINCSDEGAARYLKIYTFLPKEEIEALEKEHAEAPHRRILQKRLAQEMTVAVHGEKGYDNALRASQILFGKGTKETLLALSERELLEIFEGVPTFTIAKTDLENGLDIVEFLAQKTSIYASKGEARRSLKGNAVSINQQKIKNIDHSISTSDLLNDKYILAQQGKKKYNLVIVE